MQSIGCIKLHENIVLQNILLLKKLIAKPFLLFFFDRKHTFILLLKSTFTNTMLYNAR